MKLAIFTKWTRPYRLHRYLSRQLPAGDNPRFRLEVRPGGASKWQKVQLRKDAGRIVVSVGSRDELATEKVHQRYRFFLPVVVHLFARTCAGVVAAEAFLEDGSKTPSRRMIFSASYPDAVLAPDPEFFNSHGYAFVRELLVRQRPWRERGDEIVWRGSTTGRGRRPEALADFEAADLLPRIRMCALLRSAPGTDAKIYQVVQTSAAEAVQTRLKQVGLLGSRVSWKTWLDRKFALDIDGNTNAWSNLFIRMLLGCCVIKVGSHRGFRQWYYPRLEPWTHFVPVKPDLSDLLERIDWARSHPAECAQIAAAGQALALSMTWETEVRSCVERLNQQLRESPDLPATAAA